VKPGGHKARPYAPGPPPKEAIEFFRSKLWRVGFDFQDVWEQEHAIAFTVAKAMSYDILKDIRSGLDSALAEGKTFAQFKKELQPVLEDKGWWGKKEMVDPITGETKTAQLGSPRRLKVIYQTNLRSARSAGKWERIQRTKKLLPYLRYSLGPSEKHRPEHVAWEGLELLADDAWWDSHMPPNGWGCKCWVQQLTKAEVDATGGPDEAPADEMQDWTNPRTGATEMVPKGITPGFNFNPGTARMSAHCSKWAEALPKSKADFSFPPGLRPDLPPPRPWSGPLTYSAADDKGLVNAFLRPFGAKIGDGKVFIDKTNWPLVIDEHLFLSGGGKRKVSKFGRDKYLRVLSKTIRDPDEVWVRWEQIEDKKHPDFGKWTLRRTYLSRWESPDKKLSGFSAMTMQDKQWVGRTTFPATANQMERERAGLLAYRRE
jgi:hypothetical protein